MTKINSPISIIEYGSTHIRLAIYDAEILNNNLFFEEKIDFTREENAFKDNIIFNLIDKAEKELGQHLNEIILMMDSSSIFSLDYSIKKNYEKKKILEQDIDYLINQSENEIKINYKEKDILHIIKHKILLDGQIINEIETITTKSSKLIIELKFILIDKKISNKLKELFLKKQISVKNVFCTSFIKSEGLTKKFGMSGYSSFIDIGLKKSSLSIFRNNKLLYLNNTHIAGDHITRDINKILKIDYRTAESKKLKFFKNNLPTKVFNENDLLKKIINSRLEEIIEILFLNCPLISHKLLKDDLRLFFIGNGSKVLNENLLSFGPEFKFIKEMKIIGEKNYDCCNSAVEFYLKHKKIQAPNQSVNLENKGFFEKLFSYLN